MSTILALDMSKRSTGYATFEIGSDVAFHGTWELGSEFTPDGGTYCKLHQSMSDLNLLGKIEYVYFEDPLAATALHGHTNINSLRVLTGLAAHAESWGEAMGCRVVQRVNMTTWRKSFLGTVKRGTKRMTLKELSIERCHQLGFNPRNDDEADALGILDYACVALKIMPPWRKDEVLRPPLGGPR